MAREEQRPGSGDGRPEDGEPRPAFLDVLHTGDSRIRGRSLPIGDGVCIGRLEGDGVNLAIDDRLLSRRHATIAPLSGTSLYEVVDHDSRNGSYLDGERVHRSRAAEGAIIRLGVSLFALTTDAREEQPTKPAGYGSARDAFIGSSPTFRRLCAELELAAESSTAVLLVGEPGSGKSVSASELHRLRGGPGSLVMVACGSRAPLRLVDLLGGVDPEHPDDTPLEGFLTMAKGGSLLFDEIDLLAADLQEPLLEILQTRRYRPLGSDEEQVLDALVIGSTTANIGVAVEAGVFSAALAALFGASIEIPSLQQRRIDIPLLGQHFLHLEEPRRRLDWSVTFLEKLLLYDWPQNVRELRTVMRRATLVEEGVSTLRSAHLPKDIRRRVRMPTEDALRASSITIQAVPSRGELEELLQRHAGDVQRIADFYAKDRRHVYRWLSRHDLSVGDYRKP